VGREGMKPYLRRGYGTHEKISRLQISMDDAHGMEVCHAFADTLSQGMVSEKEREREVGSRKR
jgi:hypothetical protein